MARLDWELSFFSQSGKTVFQQTRMVSRVCSTFGYEVSVSCELRSCPQDAGLAAYPAAKLRGWYLTSSVQYPSQPPEKESFFERNLEN